MRLVRIFVLAVAALAVPLAAQSQESAYPSRPLRIVVPYPPTGLTDVLGRLIADRLGTALRQSVVVENRPGAGTLLGAEIVAKAPADGYTLLMATSTTLGISPAMYSKSPIDPVKDFAPVSWMGSVNFFFITNPAFPPKNLRELIELVKKNPGKYNYASSGSGSPHHLFMEVLKKEAGLDVQHVPYKGTIGALPDVMSGKVEMMFCDASAALPQIRAGRVIALATSAAKQTVLDASVPPVATVVPGFDWLAWQGVVAPAATPGPIIARLHAEMQRFQNTPEFRDLLVKYGMEPASPHTPEQFGETIRADVGRWAAVVKASGATID
jgi:tripartite-type tricarboxylate transporter receptor subunit TctC